MLLIGANEKVVKSEQAFQDPSLYSSLKPKALTSSKLLTENSCLVKFKYHLLASSHAAVGVLGDVLLANKEDIGSIWQ